MKRVIRSDNYYGQFFILMGILLLVPLIVVMFYPKDFHQIYAFIIPSIMSIVIGMLICMIHPKRNHNKSWKMSQYEGSLIVLFAWVIGIIFGALPFFISGQLTFIQALFEAVSGWTTTGLSVVDVTQTNHLFQFHRCFMQFCGV